MIAQLRLAWRLQRWEITFVAVACLGLAAVAWWLTLDMRSILATCGATAEAAGAASCTVIYAFQESHGAPVQLTQMAISYVPFIAGLVIGVPIVAREMEQRTALIAWPLAGSRLRWLAWRSLPPFLLVLVLSSVVAVAADQLMHAYFPRSDIGFYQYADRGVPLVMRTLLMVVAGIAIGAVIGRTLPALLVGIGLSVVVSAGLAVALPHWVPSTELTLAEVVDAGPGSLNTDVKYRTPEGELVDADAGQSMVEAAFAADSNSEPDPSTMPAEVIYGIAAGRYDEVVMRESAAIGLGIVGMGAIAAFAVKGRRAG